MSQQVNASEAVLYAEHLAAAAGTTLADAGRLLPGTPAWCELSDEGPAKMLALLAGGVREAIVNEGRQVAAVEASKAVAGAADWPAVAREIHQRAAFRAAFPWSRRIGGAA